MKVIRHIILISALMGALEVKAQIFGGHLPDVLNLNHIVIRGNTFVKPGVAFTYKADFFYPNETTNIMWVVENGTIIDENTHPGSEIYVTVIWDAPSKSTNLSLPFGVVAIGQGITNRDDKPYQGAALEVYHYSYQVNGCAVKPASQTINYGQIPNMLSGADQCYNPSLNYNYTYQWRKLDHISGTYQVISGAADRSYQPGATFEEDYYRRTVTTRNSSGTIINTATQRTDISLYPLSPGRLEATAGTSFNYGAPITGIQDEMPYGGLCTSADYIIRWEASVNGRPWQQIGSSVHFPGMLATKEKIKIRRSVQCGVEILYTNELEFNYTYTYPNRESGLNYAREHNIKTKGIESFEEADQLGTDKKDLATIYFDGLGRVNQNVLKEKSIPAAAEPTVWRDMVLPVSYDAAGKLSQRYLPYPTSIDPGKYKTDPFTPQAAYYSANYNETPAYEQVTYDNNPLGRIVNMKSAGTSWAASAGNTVTYDFNEASENVRIWSIGYAHNDVPVSTGSYSSNQLYKHKVTDEKGKQVIEYTDKSGRLILKKMQLDNNPGISHAGWICTYNVYDDWGRVRYVIQPKAVEYLEGHGWSFAGSTVAAELCFRYEYDAKGRTIFKQVAGKGEEKMLYDNRDRLVLMQNGVQESGRYNNGVSQWLFYLYDQLDREVATGQLNNTGNIPYATIKSQVAAMTAGETSVSITTNVTESVIAHNPVTTIASCSGCAGSILSVNYYDSYTFSGAKSFNTGFENYQAYNSTEPDLDEIVQSQRTLGLITGKKVKAIGAAVTTFLSTTIFYDEDERVIQTGVDNIKEGTDITTNQYHFDGRVMSTSVKHSTNGTGYTNYGVLTKYEFDRGGRPTALLKRFGNTAFKEIATYAYDEFGRLKKKRLAPGYAGTGKNEIETLNFEYNIHSEITGINKDYALKKGTYNKWDHFFGLHLGYDNRELDQLGNRFFNTALFDGLITGVVWNTQGDDVQRKYDYTYDNAGRLINADFNEKQLTSDSWNKTKADFTISGYTGKIEYDLNGNILSMLHRGVLPGTGNIVVDDLRYTYDYGGSSWTNRLVKVIDGPLNTAGASNGKFGDFKDGTNGTGSNDYDYDENGNLIKDLNKEAKNLLGTNGIKYNYLDKPEEIKIDGKGTLKIIYDVEGNKLQKIFTPVSGAAAKTSSYIDEFYYEENNLQYIHFEEGRLRVLQAIDQDNGFDKLVIDGNINMPNNKKGVFDYFLFDHLQSVRMIITEQTHWGRNKCTMENARQAVEAPLFGQIDINGNPAQGTNEVIETQYLTNSIPGDEWQSNTSEYVSRLSKLAKAVGPNAFLKVMAGDVVNAQAKYFYRNNPNSGCASSSGIITNILRSLTNVIDHSSPAGSIIKGKGGDIAGLLNGTGFTAFLDNQPCSENPNTPRAYLTVLFFDERFNFVAEGSIFDRVDQAGDGASPLFILNAKAPKNGYAYVYVSNESDEYVYFDDFEVRHDRGRIIEENHYYAYGLRIAGISSRKSADVNEGSILNRHLYNDKELIEDGDLNWYDYGFRNYDPQIGRFVQIDPLADEFPWWTTYQYAGCEPIAHSDLDGAEPTVNPATVQAIVKWIGNTQYQFVPKMAVKVEWIIEGATESFVISHLAPAGIVAKIAQKAKPWWKTALDIADKALSYVPVVGAVKDAVVSAVQGDFTGAVLNLGAAALDLATGGTAAVVRQGVKAIVKFAVKEAIEGFTGDQLGFNPKDIAKQLKQGAKSIAKAVKEVLPYKRNIIPDRHHIIQDAAVRGLPGYKTRHAPTVSLQGPPNLRGSPHYNATQVQKNSAGYRRGTYARERVIGMKALVAAGYSRTEAKATIREADKYFFNLGVDLKTVTRIPKN